MMWDDDDDDDVPSYELHPKAAIIIEKDLDEVQKELEAAIDNNRDETLEDGIFFQPLHYFLDTEHGQYSAMKRRNKQRGRINPAIESHALTKRRLKEDTLYIRGRSLDNQNMFLEFVGICFKIKVALSPLNRHLCPYPTDQLPSDQLKEERAQLAIDCWCEHQKELCDTIFEASLLTEEEQSGIQTEILSGSGFMGYRGSEQEAYLEIRTKSTNTARKITEVLLVEKLSVSALPFPVKFELYDPDYNPFIRFMASVFNSTTKWMRLIPAVSTLDGYRVEYESCTELHFRIPAERADEALAVLTDDELREYKIPLTANFVLLSKDIEEFFPVDLNVKDPDARISSIAASVKLGPKRYLNRVFMYLPQNEPIPKKFQNIVANFYDAKTKTLKPGAPNWFRNVILENNGELPTRENANLTNLPDRVECDLGGWAKVCIFESEEDMLWAYAKFRRLVITDYETGFNQNYFDDEAIATCCKRYRGLWDYYRRSCLIPWYRGRMRTVDKQSNAAMVANRTVLVEPFCIHIDTRDIAQSLPTRLLYYDLKTVSTEYLKKTKIEVDFDGMFFCWWNLHTDTQDKYVMRDATLPLELLETWQTLNLYTMFAEQTYCSVRMIVEYMLTARLYNCICVMCEQQNKLIHRRDLESFQSVEIAGLQNQEAKENYAIIPLQKIVDCHEELKVLTCFKSNENAEKRHQRLETIQNYSSSSSLSLSSSSLKNKTVLFNVYDLPEWELRRLAEATPDNPRCKGGAVQEAVKEKAELAPSPDVNAMYPSIVIENNLSPETIVIDPRFFCDKVPYKTVHIENLSENDYVPLCYKYVQFENAIYPTMLRRWKLERNRFKKLQESNKKEYESLKAVLGVDHPDVNAAYGRYRCYEAYQLAVKQLSNALYGYAASGKRTGKCPCNPLGTTITYLGRTFIKNAIERFIAEGYVILYGDTDSLFVKDLHAEAMRLVLKYTAEEIQVLLNAPDKLLLDETERDILRKQLAKQLKYSEQDLFDFVRDRILKLCDLLSKETGLIFEVEKIVRFGMFIKKKTYAMCKIDPCGFYVPLPDFDEERKNGKIDCRGVRGGVRRDVTKFVQSLLRDFYRVCLFSKSRRELLVFLINRAVDLWLDRVPVEDCAITQAIKKYLHYMVANSGRFVPLDKFFDENRLPVHAYLAKEEYRLNPGQPIMPGDRITYIVGPPNYSLCKKDRYTKRLRAMEIKRAKAQGIVPYKPDIMRGAMCEVVTLLTIVHNNNVVTTPNKKSGMFLFDPQISSAVVVDYKQQRQIEFNAPRTEKDWIVLLNNILVVLDYYHRPEKHAHFKQIMTRYDAIRTRYLDFCQSINQGERHALDLVVDYEIIEKISMEQRVVFDQLSKEIYDAEEDMLCNVFHLDKMPQKTREQLIQQRKNEHKQQLEYEAELYAEDVKKKRAIALYGQFMQVKPVLSNIISNTAATTADQQQQQKTTKKRTSEEIETNGGGGAVFDLKAFFGQPLTKKRLTAAEKTRAAMLRR